MWYKVCVKRAVNYASEFSLDLARRMDSDTVLGPVLGKPGIIPSVALFFSISCLLFVTAC